MWAVLKKQKYRHGLVASLVLGCLMAVAMPLRAHAITPLPTPQPAGGSYGLEATKKQAPPTTSATISTPGNGASFGDSPITVSGLCTTGLLVQVYDNGVMVGAPHSAGHYYSAEERARTHLA
jgi:hypothetical protein